MSEHKLVEATKVRDVEVGRGRFLRASHLLLVACEGPHEVGPVADRSEQVRRAFALWQRDGAALAAVDFPLLVD